MKQVNKGMLLKYYCQYLGVTCLKYEECTCPEIKMKTSKKRQVRSLITSIPKTVLIVTT